VYLDHLLELTFARCWSPEAVASSALELALQVAGAPKGNVQLVDWAENPGLKIVAQRGFEEEFLDCFRVVHMADPSACGRALMLRQPVIIEDVPLDRDFAPFAGVVGRAGVRSVVSQPLVSSGGALYGMMSTHGAAAGRPSFQQLEALEQVAKVAANTIVRLHVLRRATVKPRTYWADPREPDLAAEIQRRERA
jgi:GAF domain-containing protein